MQEPPFDEKPKFFASFNEAVVIPEDQRRMRKLVESFVYEGISGLVVLFNVVIIILETDLRADGSDEPPWVNISNWSLLIYYAIDITLRLYAYRMSFFLTRWNILDFGLIVSDVVFKILELTMGDAPSFSMLRLCKIFRVMRFARAVSMFKELHMMLSGFISAMKALFWASFMLTIMLTFWSILAVEILHPINSRLADRNVYEGCERCPRAFSSVFHANLTFLQQIIAGDSWGLVSVPIIEEEPLTAGFFFAVLLTVNFGLLNLVLTVIVDSAQAAREADTERKLAEKSKDFEHAKKKLLKVCSELDQDGSGELTYPELMEGMDAHPDFSATMALLDINKDDMNIVFDMLDQDNSGSVTFVEFVEQLHKMKSQDDHTMLIFIRGYLNEVRKKLGEQLRYLTEETHGAIHQTLDQSRELKETFMSFCTGVNSNRSSSAPHSVNVSIAGTKGLHEYSSSNGNGTSGSSKYLFCVCEVEGKPKARIQTPSVASVKDAHWNFDDTLNGYAPGDSLVFTVWDKTHKTNELLGQAVVSAEVLRQNPSFVGKVPLTRAGKTFASLEVKVEDLMPKAVEAVPSKPAEPALPSLKSISEDIKLLFNRLDGDFAQSRVWPPNGQLQAPAQVVQRGPSWPPKADSRGNLPHAAPRAGGPEMESPCPCCKVSQAAGEKAQIRPLPRIQPQPP